MVKKKGATQKQGGEEHAAAALAALREAGKGTWEDGEPRLMAQLLANQHRLEPPELASEQVRQQLRVARRCEQANDLFQGVSEAAAPGAREALEGQGPQGA